jgi:polysaccharide export outer membrane protein
MCRPESRAGRFITGLIAALLVCLGSARAVGAQQAASSAGASSGSRGTQTATILASAPGDPMGEYLIGPDDLLSISVLESPDLSRDVRVSSDGTVGLPLLAEHPHVSGLSLAQAEALLKKKYQESGILNDPNITIVLKDLESKPVTVSGAVRSPGVFQVSGSVRLLRLLSLAGGVGENAGTSVQVIHEEASGKQIVTEVHMSDLRLGLENANVPVRGGDIVNVPPAGAIYVLGAVNRPGRYSLPSDTDETTVLNVLALAADTTRTAKLSQCVLLRRKGASSDVEQIPLDLKKIRTQDQPDVVVRANDVLYVPDSGAKRAFSRSLEAAMQVATGVLLLGAVP